MTSSFRYRAIFDVDLRARPLTRAFLRERTREPRELAASTDLGPSASKLPTEQELAPQRALQAELCRDEASLHAWMAANLMLSVQEGHVVDDGLDVEYSDDLLLTLAERLPMTTRLEVLQALRDPTYGVCLDEFWFSFHQVAGRIEVAVEAALPPSRDQVVGRRLRATVPITVGVDRPEDVTLERCLRRRAESERDRASALHPAEYARPAWEAPLPTEHDLQIARELLTAAYEVPRAVDDSLQRQIIVDIRDGFLCDSQPELSVFSALRPLIDRLAPEHRAHLLRPSRDENWIDRVWDLWRSFEETTTAITVLRVGG